MVMSDQLLDLASVRTFLSRRFPAVEELRRFPRGEWSSAFGFRAAGRELVVRFGGYREDYAKDRSAASWAGPDLPIPRVLDVGRAFDGLIYAVSERARGVDLDSLDGRGFGRILPALFRALDALQAVDPPGSGYGLWRADDGSAPYPTWSEFLLSVAHRDDDRMRGWRTALSSVPGAEASFDVAYAGLERLVAACPDDRRVIHGDLLAGNVLVDSDRLTGVFDWGNSLVGDPLYDVAWLTFWAPWHPAIDATRIRAMARELFGGSGLDERLRCYEVHIGLDAQQYNALTGRWDELARSAERTLALIGS